MSAIAGPGLRVLAAVCALATAACAGGFERQSWREARTSHFSIASSATPELTRDIATKLEFFHAAALELLGIERFTPVLPTQVYVFADRPSFARYQYMPGISGFFTRGADSNYIVIDASDERSALAIAYHEYVHYLLYNATSFKYPAWYHEGLAEFLSTLEVDEAKQKVVVGDVPMGRLANLAFGTPLSLKRVLDAKDTRRWSRRARAMYYAQAWAFTHYAFAGTALGLPNRSQALVDYLTRLDAGEPTSEAFERAFGTSMEALEPEVLTYGRGKQFGFARRPLPAYEAREVELRPLPRAEHLYLLAQLSSELRRFRPPDPERLLRLAVRSDPAHAPSTAALGALLCEAGDPEGDALLQRALERAGGDPRIQLAAGQALQARAQREPENVRELRRQARERFERALELDPNLTRAAQSIALDALATGEQLDAAIDRLETARKRRPDYADLDLLVAQLYLARGKRDAAREALRVAVLKPHGGEADAPEQIAQLNTLLERTGLGAIVDDPDAHLDAALEWIGPRDEERFEGVVPLAPVKGRAGLGDAFLHDAIIVIDESGSTRALTDFDANGDGTTDATRGGSPLDLLKKLAAGARALAGDTVRAAELAAARRLIERLDPATTRVGVVTFSLDAQVLAPLGTPDAARAAIDAHENPSDDSLTNLAQALVTSLTAFAANAEPGTRRQRSILLLSDGAPTSIQGPELAELQALTAADALADYGVRVHTFAIVGENVKESSAYPEIAKRTAGRYVAVSRVADVTAELLDVRLSSLDGVEMRNRTSGESGRAVRSFPDGSFDGYVPLTPGWNELEIRVQVRGRPPLTQVRRVQYIPPAAPTEADRAEAQRVLEELRTRTIETELIPIRRRPAETPVDPGREPETARGDPPGQEGPPEEKGGTLGRRPGRGDVQIEVAPERPAPPDAPEAPAP